MSALGRFFGETRAAAGIAAALVSVMVLGGTALIVDHLWLVGQRDATKAAVDAATLAATLEMQSLSGELSQAERTRVESVAKRYALFNLQGNVPAANEAEMARTLHVEVPERAGGLIRVTVRADLGDTLLSKALLGYAGPGSITASAGFQPSINPTELVLAVDVSRSMANSLAGGYLAAGHQDSRMEIVKRAALDLLDVLGAAAANTGDNAQLAIGVVPWHHMVRLGATARTKWKDSDWATFPTEHDYPHPPDGKGPAAPAHPVRQTLPAQGALGSRCRAWQGCLESRASGVARTALPSSNPFLMRFFSPEPSYSYIPSSWYVSFGCQNYRDGEARRNGWRLAACYDWSRMTYQTDYNKCYATRAYSGSGAPTKIQPQEDCSGMPEILPLTTDLDVARTAVRALQPASGSTNSSLAVTWAERLLTPEWRETWGGETHPMAPAEGQTLKKVLVLLTDGEDNHPNTGGAPDARRSAACTAIKDAGVQVFTIAAMRPSGHLAGQLRACSSQSDDPAGTYAFVNNATREKLAQAFREIGRQLVVMRRVY